MTENSRDIGLLADYAREVVREYLHLQSNEEPAEENAMWQGFRVSGKIVAKQFRETNPDLFSDDIRAALKRRSEQLHQWMTNPPEELEPLAELAVLFELQPEDVEIFTMAAAPAIDPTVEELYSYVRNNVHKRNADVGFLCQVLGLGQQKHFEKYLRRCAFDAPLRKHRLCLLEARQNADDRFDLNLVSRRIRASDRVLEFVRLHGVDDMPNVDEALASVTVRVRDTVSVEELGLPDYASDTLMQLARTRTLPAVLIGPAGAGKQKSAQALAGPMKRGVLSADLTALLNEDPETIEILLAELFREARLGGDLVYLYGHGLPDDITGPMLLVIERTLLKEAVVLGTDKLPVWGAELTAGWPVCSVPLPDEGARLRFWNESFKNDRVRPTDESIETVARRYQLSAGQIRQAAAESRRLAQVNRRRKVGLVELDRACRAHFQHQLNELAQLIPPTTFSIADLILPVAEKGKFEEVLLYAKEREAIFSEWGFAEKFPYGRGLSMLFYGPPGTGKSMSAMIIANHLGVDLFRVDVSRILSRYVGETEKNLAKVFDEAERGRCMLLFDEADALFTKRTDVHTSVDRYANLEVSYLLQRMENFEGITMLTTNVEHLLDDAFKRRLRYRIYFPLPDAELRAKLWETLIPKGAPRDEQIAFDLLGEYFELSGGHIKQAVLRGAVYARRDKVAIGFLSLLESAQAECRELGMLVSDRLPKKLESAVAQAKQQRVKKVSKTSSGDQRASASSSA